MGRRRRSTVDLAGSVRTVVQVVWVMLGLGVVAGLVEALGIEGALTVLFLVGVLAVLVILRGRKAAREALQAEEERQWRALGEMSIAQLDQLSGRDFERWAAKRLREAGFEVELTPASGDFGVDLVAVANGVRFGIQAKRRQGPVGNQVVQAVTAGCDHFDCEIGVVLTTSRFTPAAVTQAKGCRRRILLIDRGGLVDLSATLRAASAR